ncbi:MAG: hypothetical protein V3574_01820 [Candidatus Moraniibacteriota bacterium]
MKKIHYAVATFFLLAGSSVLACTNSYDCGGSRIQPPSQTQTQGQGQAQSLNNNIDIGVVTNPSSNATSTSDTSSNANNEGVTQSTNVTTTGGAGGMGGNSTSSSNALVGNVGGGAGGVGIGGSSSSHSNASVGNVEASLTYEEVKQYPIPGEINLPGLLQTPNNDKPGPYYYDPQEMLYVKYVFTLEELEVMAEGKSPEIMGDLIKKKELPENQWSPEIAFYIEAPSSVAKSSIQQVGMMTLDSDSKKIDTPILFGVAGREAAKRGANAVIITGDGYQREDAAFSFGPGASITSPSGNTISTIALPFVYAKRWKEDYPWLHATAVIVPTKPRM